MSGICNYEMQTFVTAPTFVDIFGGSWQEEMFLVVGQI